MLKIKLFVLFFTIVLFATLSYAEELTITTYYPSPHGSYNELTTTGNTYLAINVGSRVGIGMTDPKSVLQVVGLPVYANNAAAVASGLTAGAFYRTGSDPDLVCVVH